MLMDIIGVAIGFCVVMLLLSLIVTSLAQATQALLRIRGRNLRYALAAALANANENPDPDSLKDASDLLNRCDDAALRRQKDPTSLLSRILGPRMSWLEDGALESALREKAEEINADVKGSLDAADIDKTVTGVVDRFQTYDKPMKSRFELIMRGVSLTWAVVVAGVFQVSATDLIEQLSTDPALRAEYATIASQTLGDAALSGTGADATDVGEPVAQLSRINITPLRYGAAFYTDKATALPNIIGVIMTAILLTLGAPFWYSALETAVRWRDLFAPPKKTSDPEEAKGNDT